MVANGTPAPGGCQGLLALGTQTWITVCLGFFFNSIKIYYFVQGLSEILLGLPIPHLWRILLFVSSEEGDTETCSPRPAGEGPSGGFRVNLASGSLVISCPLWNDVLIASCLPSALKAAVTLWGGA